MRRRQALTGYSSPLSAGAHVQSTWREQQQQLVPCEMRDREREFVASDEGDGQQVRDSSRRRLSGRERRAHWLYNVR